MNDHGTCTFAFPTHDSHLYATPPPLLPFSRPKTYRRSGRLPWTVDCSLHSWLENRRPFSRSVLTVAPDDLSVDWVINTASNGGGTGISSTARSAGSVGGVPLPAEWNGIRLEGVWDVIENTMLRSPSLPRLSSSSPKVVPPLTTFKALLAGSGAQVLTRGGEIRRRDNGESLSSPRAKL